jgi:O-antigen/teichoic acid export membrane protein
LALHDEDTDCCFDGPDMTLNKFTRNTIFGLIASLNSALGSFLGLVIVGRVLGPVGAGTVAIGIWLTGMAVTFADLGLPLTIARFAPELTARGQLAYADELGPYFLRPILLTTTLVAGVFGELALGGAEWIRENLKLRLFSESPDTIWFVIAFLFVAQALNNFGLSILRGRQRFDVAAKLTAIGLPLQLVATAVGCVTAGALCIRRSIPESLHRCRFSCSSKTRVNAGCLSWSPISVSSVPLKRPVRVHPEPRAKSSAPIS